MLLKIGWVSKFMIGKRKRGTGGLGQPPIPLMRRRWGKDPVMAPGSFPPKGGDGGKDPVISPGSFPSNEKVLYKLYKINIKEVLIQY